MSFRYCLVFVCESRKQFTSNLRGASPQPTELCRDSCVIQRYRRRSAAVHTTQLLASPEKKIEPCEIPQHNHLSFRKHVEPYYYIGQTQSIQGHIANIQAQFRPPGPTNLDDNDLQSTTFSELAWRVCGVLFPEKSESRCNVMINIIMGLRVDHRHPRISCNLLLVCWLFLDEYVGQFVISGFYDCLT